MKLPLSRARALDSMTGTTGGESYASIAKIHDATTFFYRLFHATDVRVVIPALSLNRVPLVETATYMPPLCLAMDRWAGFRTKKYPATLSALGVAIWSENHTC
eukprot:1196850-Amphidinium_carterae.1